MWEEMIIHFVLGVVTAAIKNPAKAASLKGILITVRDAIETLYPGA